MSAPDLRLLARIVDCDPDGIVIVDALAQDQPLVYANPAFVKMTGYAAAELVGRNPRLLQGGDRDQDARQKLRRAIDAGESCRVLIRNYRKDGAPFSHELAIEPLKDGAGRVTHYIGFCRESGRDSAERVRADAKSAGARDNNAGAAASISVARDDRLTGLYNRAHFEDLVRRDWAIAQRDGRSVSWFLFDIDALGLYNETFGRNAGDACIRRVARTIAAQFRRASDLTARYDGGTVIAASIGMTAELAAQHARTIRDKVAELHIHHPRCTVQKFVTVSSGITAGVPSSQDVPQVQIDKVVAALKQAKQDGRNRVHEAT